MSDTQEKDDKIIYQGGGLKALGDGKVGGYLVLFTDETSPDLAGDYFTAETNFGDATKSPVWFHHRIPFETEDGQEIIVKEQIGDAELKYLDDGVFAEAVIYNRKRYDRLIDSLGWSSGTSPHLVDREQKGDAYHIKQWLLGQDASLTFGPAEPRNSAVSIKSITNEKIKHPELKSLLPESGNASVKADDQADISEVQTPEKESEIMADEAKKETVQDDKQDAILDALKGISGRIDALETKAAPEPVVEDKVADHLKNVGGGNVPNANVRVGSRKHANTESSHLLLAAQLLEVKNGKTVHDIEAAAEMKREVLLRVKSGERKENEVFNTQAQIGNPGGVSVKSFDETNEVTADIAAKAWQMDERAISEMKADELNYTTQAGFGAEWVGHLYSGMMWDEVVFQSPVMSALKANGLNMPIPQGTNAVTIPTINSRPTFYKGTEATSQDSNPGRITPTVTTSKVGTGNRVLTAEKFSGGNFYSEEQQEDSMVNYAQWQQTLLTREFADMIESAVIDGDTATALTTNINDIAGTPAGNETYLNFDGFRKHALVTYTGQSRDGGALDIKDYLETLKLLGVAGANALPTNTPVGSSPIAFAIPADVYYWTMALAEMENNDFGAFLTIQNGVITQVYGRPILGTSNYLRTSANRLANATGKVDQDVPGNNVAGMISAIDFRKWVWGVKREFKLVSQYDIYADAWVTVAHARYGLQHQDEYAAAATYNTSAAA